VEALVPLLEDRVELKLACADQRSRRYSAWDPRVYWVDSFAFGIDDSEI
jgi:hypothetical protein